MTDAKTLNDKVEHLQKQVEDVSMVLHKGRLKGHTEVMELLNAEAMELVRAARNLRALGQEIPGKLKEESAKHLLSLISSLPTRLRELGEK